MKRFVLFGFLFFIAACGNSSAQPEEGTPSEHTIVSYDNGVFYFPVTRANFGRTISQVIADNDSLELVDVVGDGTDYNGIDAGYFVFTRRKGTISPVSEASESISGGKSTMEAQTRMNRLNSHGFVPMRSRSKS